MVDIKDGIEQEKEIHVGIGEIAVASAPAKLKTVLGSCIALSIYVSQLRLGGMAHILLQGDDGESLRYSGPATRELIERIRGKIKGDERLIAKLAGGASSSIGDDNPLLRNLGKRTMLHVVKILVDEGIDIFGMHIGGREGRNVIFDLSSGKLEITTASDGRIVI